ncbi:Succinate--hydroxymethylglutarate CoA-transferase [Anabarilius grahami]|uniref:Succinate--hydroxymethylglutarate CoA-transferase n=1 Tax=Anabarilius grahami TaxID=495550 RepID=A0A3N0XPL1_ANAGA|nr:Succinate--hydroxymethylglutarate CoA-transferase [Anabarilius grahami]
MILGDLGAEVIKVERPGSGDDTRAWGPPFVGDESAYFLSVNRNKKSIAVNLKDPKGTKLVTELAKVCDVLVENYLPGKLNEMGLGYEDLSEVAPQLIYCSITELQCLRPNGGSVLAWSREQHDTCDADAGAGLRSDINTEALQ